MLNPSMTGTKGQTGRAVMEAAMRTVSVRPDTMAARLPQTMLRVDVDVDVPHHRPACCRTPQDPTLSVLP